MAKFVLVVGLAGAGAVAPAAGGDRPRPALRLPAPVTVVGAKRTFQIARDGTARRVAGPQTYPRGATWFPATGTWFAYRGGHLIVGLHRRALWRSRERLVPSQVGLIIAGSGLVAFQHAHRLYIAPDGGAERAVASREAPVGWTAGGLYTYRYRDHQLLLRSGTGRLVAVIGRPTGSNEFVSDGVLYFIAHGAVMRAAGTGVRQVAAVAGLGFSPRSVSLQPLGGGLVELFDGRRIAVLRPNGTLLAAAPVPRSHRRPETVSSSLALAPGAGAVAFTATSGDDPNPRSAVRVVGTETIYLLRAGAHAAVALHRERVAFQPCERGAGVQWHGSWLLYTASEGTVAVIDATGRHRSIELTNLARSLSGTRSGFSAYWSGQVPLQ